MSRAEKMQAFYERATKAKQAVDAICEGGAWPPVSGETETASAATFATYFALGRYSDAMADVDILADFVRVQEPDAQSVIYCGHFRLTADGWRFYMPRTRAVMDELILCETANRVSHRGGVRATVDIAAGRTRDSYETRRVIFKTDWGTYKPDTALDGEAD